MGRLVYFWVDLYWYCIDLEINILVNKKYMKLQLEKFGKTLISRELGSEALKAFQPTLRELPKGEDLEIDFSGVLTLSPSWADEFLSPLLNQLDEKLYWTGKFRHEISI